MNKSDILDELRLEVGLVPEYANTLREFYTGVVQVLGKDINEKDYTVSIYETKESSFQLISSSGKPHHPILETFGEGLLSLCAIRGKVSTYPIENYQSVIAPFYSGHHLLGMLIVDLPTNEYEITDEDFIFMREVSRFIEVQQKRYNRYIY